jgi:hypothetical protein
LGAGREQYRSVSLVGRQNQRAPRVGEPDCSSANLKSARAVGGLSLFSICSFVVRANSGYMLSCVAILTYIAFHGLLEMPSSAREPSVIYIRSNAASLGLYTGHDERSWRNRLVLPFVSEKYSCTFPSLDSKQSRRLSFRSQISHNSVSLLFTISTPLAILPFHPQN